MSQHSQDNPEDKELNWVENRSKKAEKEEKLEIGPTFKKDKGGTEKKLTGNRQRI